MKRFLLALLFAPLCGSAVAQTVKTETKEDGTVNFFAEDKLRPETLTIFLTFTEMENCNEPKGTTKYEVTSSRQRLLSLRPVDHGKQIGYRYSYRLFWGKVDPKIDTTFVYRMPVTTRKPVRMSRGSDLMVSLRNRSERNEQNERKELGMHFWVEKGDTIYSMRRGVVTGVRIAAPRDPNAPEIHFTTKTSALIVEHPDGSVAAYDLLDGENIFVKEGDELLPGTPLALAGSFDGKFYKVMVDNSWYITNTQKDDRNFVVSRDFFPCFATTDGVIFLQQGTYTAVCDDAMIMREMSKKEQKKWLGSKGK